MSAPNRHAPPSRFWLALEGRAVFEWAAWGLSWPLLKRTAPRGDGHPVMVFPGLVAGDSSTWPMRRFLDELGYASYPWEQGLNVGPRPDVVRRLVDRLHQIEDRHGESVSLIGWSLGGAMARALAAQHEAKVRSVITLGSPLQGNPRANHAWRLFEFVSGFRVDDPELHAQRELLPQVPTTAILSRSDGVVAWQTSLAEEHPLFESIQVPASHLGMGANPLVLWAIADRLSQPQGEWQRFDHGQGWHPLVFSDPGRPRAA